MESSPLKGAFVVVKRAIGCKEGNNIPKDFIFPIKSQIY